MRLFRRKYFLLLFIMPALVAVLTFPLPSHSSDGGYRLLELDGYKVKWGEQRLGAGAKVSYAFAEESLQFAEAHNCRNLAPMATLSGEDLSMETLAKETAEAFRVWERAAGLSFYEVGNAHEADIILGAQGNPRGKAFANVSYAPDVEGGVRAIERSLVCMNPDHRWKVGFDGNEDVYDIRYTLIHEIGHALGLDHPGPSGQVMGFRYTEAFEGLQAGDLRGIRLLYGRATNEVGPDKTLETQLAQKSIEDYQVDPFNSEITSAEVE